MLFYQWQIGKCMKYQISLAFKTTKTGEVFIYKQLLEHSYLKMPDDLVNMTPDNVYI